MRRRNYGLAAIGIVLCASATTAFAVEPDAKCASSKLGASAKYAQCRLKADSKAAKEETTADYGKCNLDKFSSAEDKGEGMCPSSGDQTSVEDFLAACTDSVALTLDGGVLPLDVITCNADLDVCLSAPLCGDGAVGSGEDCDAGNLDGETCVTQGFAGGTLACAAGCAFDTSDCYATRFDASGATIIDHQTGLEWEKKDSADSVANLANPHDVDNFYQWTSTGTAPDGQAFTNFLAKLNGSDTGNCYAGHCDWRLPTIEELQGVPWPAVSAFQPDAASYYWSATTDTDNPAVGRGFQTGASFEFFSFKTNTGFYRAVRTGS